MSTRWYPLYQRGSPQLRIFLPNFWLKLIKPRHPQPDNVVQFACSMEMTRVDIKTYLEKLYNVNVLQVRTRIAPGIVKRDKGKGYIIKEDDAKIAYVSLPINEKFEFPNIFPEKADNEAEDDMKSLDESKVNFRQYLNRNKNRPSTPSWYSL